MFEQIFENITEGIVLVNDQGFVLMANSSFLNMFGYKRDEVIDESIDNFVPTRLKEKHKTYRKSFNENPRQRPMGYGMDLYGQRKNGSHFPVEISLSYVNVGDRVNTIAFVIDISDRKNAENAVRREKELAQLYLETAEAIIVVLDRDGNINLLNEKGCKILGYLPEEVKGLNWFQFIVEPEERKEVRQVFLEMLNGEKEIVEFYENHVVTKDGNSRLIEWHNKVIKGDDGQVIGTISSGIDITEMRELEKLNLGALHRGQEEERKRLAKELHDGLVQTLSAVNINLNVLEENVSSMNEDDRNAYRNAITLLNEAINDTRSLSHDLVPAVLESGGLIPAIQQIFTRIPSALDIKFEYGDDLDRFDPEIELAIYRIVQELINNAIKHAEANEIRIKLYQNNKFIILEIKDDGKGFRQELSQLKLNGIGLRNINSRVNSINGKLTLTSRPGHGVHALIEIPLS